MPLSLSSVAGGPRRAALGILAIVAIAGPTACGGGSSSSTTSTTSSSTTTSTSTSASALRQLFDKALRQNLSQQQGLTSSQVDCVINELDQKLSDADIAATVAAVQSGNFPKKVQQIATQAGIDCAGA